MKKFSSHLFILALFLLTPVAIQADQVSDLQAKIAETETQRKILLEEQKKLQTQIDEASKQGSSLKGTLSVLEASKKKIDNDLKVTQSSINSANLTIQKLALTIDEKQHDVETHKDAIAQSLRMLSGYDSESLVTEILNRRSIADIWRDSDSLKSIEDSLGDNIVALQNAQLELSKQKSDKEAKKAELSGLKSQLSGQKASVVETANAKAKLLTQTQNQEAAYRKLLADNVAREKQFEAQLFEFESALKVAIDPSKLPSVGHSVLAWPLDKVRITQQFGKTTSSGRLYSSGTHNGVDFGTSVGTAVKTVRGGVVKAMGNTDSQTGCYSYGRWILVEHDNGLTSLYAHLSSSIVTTGQALNTGDVIGYSGGAPGAFGSGFSTGPHLHLGLYATQAVRVERYVSSLNCKNVSIPIAPPEAYLDALAYLPAL